MTYMSNDGKRGHRLTGVAPSRRHGAHASMQHGCGLARRPEGSRAMKRETREELAEVFRDGWPVFLFSLVGGMIVGSAIVLLVRLLG